MSSTELEVLMYYKAMMCFVVILALVKSLSGKNVSEIAYFVWDVKP